MMRRRVTYFHLRREGEGLTLTQMPGPHLFVTFMHAFSTELSHLQASAVFCLCFSTMAGLLLFQGLAVDPRKFIP